MQSFPDNPRAKRPPLYRRQQRRRARVRSERRLRSELPPYGSPFRVGVPTRRAMPLPTAARSQCSLNRSFDGVGVSPLNRGRLLAVPNGSPLAVLIKSEFSSGGAYPSDCLNWSRIGLLNWSRKLQFGVENSNLRVFERGFMSIGSRSLFRREACSLIGGSAQHGLPPVPPTSKRSFASDRSSDSSRHGLREVLSDEGRRAARAKKSWSRLRARACAMRVPACACFVRVCVRACALACVWGCARSTGEDELEPPGGGLACYVYNEASPPPSPPPSCPRPLLPSLPPSPLFTLPRPRPPSASPFRLPVPLTPAPSRPRPLPLTHSPAPPSPPSALPRHTHPSVRRREGRWEGGREREGQRARARASERARARARASE